MNPDNLRRETTRYFADVDRNMRPLRKIGNRPVLVTATHDIGTRQDENIDPAAACGLYMQNASRIIDAGDIAIQDAAIASLRIGIAIVLLLIVGQHGNVPKGRLPQSISAHRWNSEREGDQSEEKIASEDHTLF
jgi:hypothetical protein